MRSLLVAAALMLVAAPAVAQERYEDYGPPRRLVGYATVCVLFECRWEPRYARTGVPIYTHHHRPPIGYYPPPVRYHHPAYPPQPTVVDSRDGPRCVQQRVTAIGVESYDKDKAREAAQSSYAEIVRARYGGKWMDLANAEAVTFECWKSASGNRASEKAADFGGRELQQCEVQAIPCRAKREVVASDDPVTQSAIEQLERRGYEVKVQDPSSAHKKPRLIRRFLKSRE